MRNINGYGSIDNVTVEFAISVFDEYQKMGIGTALMKKMLEYLKKLNYPKASLAVQKENYAVRMYQKVGFEIAYENEQEYIMIHRLSYENENGPDGASAWLPLRHATSLLFRYSSFVISGTVSCRACTNKSSPL